MNDDLTIHPDGPPPRANSVVRYPDESADAYREWLATDEAQIENETARQAEGRGQLRGKYDALKQFLQYVERMRDKFERRAETLDLRVEALNRRATHQGYALLAILVAIIVLWTASSIIYRRPVFPWEMLSIFGPGHPPPPPNGGPPNGHPAP